MNTIIIVFFLACLSQTFATNLTCNGVKFIEGFPDFSNISDYLPRTIQNINEQNIFNGEIELWDKTFRVGTGEILTSTNVDLDFSEGDQYSNFLFKKDEWESFWKSRQQTILSGFYVDSFSWADGDHIRAKFLIECRRA